MMHILHLETGRHLYGGARQALYLIQGLAELGVTGTLVSLPDTPVAIGAKARGLAVAAMPSSGDLDLRFMLRLAALIRRIRPAIVHVHSRRGADSLGGLAAGLAGVPAVLSRRVDSPDTAMVGALKYRCYRRVVAVSDCIRAQLLTRGLPEAKLRLVRSAVDPRDCQPTWSRERFLKEFDLGADNPAIAVVAQLIPRKGHHHLLKALPRIRAACPGVRVMRVGTGPLESRLRQQAARAGLASSLRFAGYRPDMLDFLGHTQLLVHPAVREGLGVGLLEAQAAGVPVVGFRAGGIPEAVAEGTTGLLVPPGDAEALAAAAVKLLYNPPGRRKMGAAARDWVAAEFNLERMVQGNLDIYRELVDAAVYDR